MIKVGITGQMGSGKSFVTRTFNKQFEVPILLMDDMAKDIQVTNKELIGKLSKRFPEGYPNGVLDKFKMREILFSDKTGKNLIDMNTIILPYITQELQNFYEVNKDANYVIIETALLFEHKLEKMFDVVLFVHSDSKLRKEKALERDGITSEEYDNRMSKQLPDEVKFRSADYVICNDYTDNVLDEIYKVHTSLKNKIINNGNGKTKTKGAAK